MISTIAGFSHTNTDRTGYVQIPADPILERVKPPKCSTSTIVMIFAVIITILLGAGIVFSLATGTWLIFMAIAAMFAILALVVGGVIIAGNSGQTIDYENYLKAKNAQQDSIKTKIIEAANITLSKAEKQLKTSTSLVNTLNKEVDTLLKTTAQLGTEVRELVIYRAIKDKRRKLTEAMISLETYKSDMDKNLDKIDFKDDLSRSSYMQRFSTLSTELKTLRKQISDLEDKIENVTGDLTHPLEEVLGSLGLRISDFNKLLGRDETSTEGNAYKTVCDRLQQRGVRDILDLKDKGIITDKNDTELLIARIADFINKTPHVKQT